MKCFRFWKLALVLFCGARAEAKPPPPRSVQLPSALPSGVANVDTIHFEWYPAQNTDGKAAPAVVVLHALGGSINVTQSFARYFARKGVSAAVMELPYHYHRRSEARSNPLSRWNGQNRALQNGKLPLRRLPKMRPPIPA